MKDTLDRLKATWERISHAHRASAFFSFTHAGAHCGYFALVALEGHGMYASMAGWLFVITMIGLIFHWGE